MWFLTLRLAKTTSVSVSVLVFHKWALQDVHRIYLFHKTVEFFHSLIEQKIFTIFLLIEHFFVILTLWLKVQWSNLEIVMLIALRKVCIAVNLAHLILKKINKKVFFSYQNFSLDNSSQIQQKDGIFIAVFT